MKTFKDLIQGDEVWMIDNELRLQEKIIKNIFSVGCYRQLTFIDKSSVWFSGTELNKNRYHEFFIHFETALQHLKLKRKGRIKILETKIDQSLIPEIEKYKKVLDTIEFPKNFTTTIKFKHIINANGPVYYVDKKKLRIIKTELRCLTAFNVFINVGVTDKEVNTIFFLYLNSCKSEDSNLHTTRETAVKELIRYIRKRIVTLEDRMNNFIKEVSRLENENF